MIGKFDFYNGEISEEDIEKFYKFYKEVFLRKDKRKVCDEDQEFYEEEVCEEDEHYLEWKVGPATALFTLLRYLSEDELKRYHELGLLDNEESLMELAWEIMDRVMQDKRMHYREEDFTPGL